MKSMETKLDPKGSPFEGITAMIGIDPGVHTGLALVDGQRLVLVASPAPTILEAMERVEAIVTHNGRQSTLVLWEDARLIGGMHGMRRGSAGDTARLRGVGSVHRDCSIWEEFLTRGLFEHHALSPSSKGAKLSAPQFTHVTGWSQPTNEHSRDAAMLIWGKRGLTPAHQAKPSAEQTA
jgi:hypothetical protein